MSLEPSSVFTWSKATSGFPSGGAIGMKSRQSDVPRIRVFPASTILVGAVVRSDVETGPSVVGPLPPQPLSKKNVQATLSERQRMAVFLR